MNTPKFANLCIIACMILIGCNKKETSRPPRSTNMRSPKVEQREGSEMSTKSDNGTTTSHPDTVTPIQRRRQIADEIKGLIGNSSDGLNQSQWRALKKRYWVPAFNETVPFGTPGAPLRVKDLLDALDEKQSPVSQLLTGSFTSINDPAEQDALIALHLVAMVIAGNGGASMPVAFIDSADKAEIAKGDLVLFEIFSDAFTESKNRKILTQQELKSWELLAGSPNAVYRLLALDNYCHSTPGPQEWLSFYRLYLNEKNLDILERVTALAVMTARPEAAGLLADMKAQTTAATPQDLVRKMDESIKWLQTLPKEAERGQ